MKLVWFWRLRSLLASRHVLAPRWRLPWHESGDDGRDASKNLRCIRHLELAELQSWGLDDNHCVSLAGENRRSDAGGIYRQPTVEFCVPHEPRPSSCFFPTTLFQSHSRRRETAA